MRPASRETADPLVQIQRTVRELLGHHRVAEIFATEIAVLHYSIGAWRARPHVPDGGSAFSHHQRNGHAGFILGLLLLLAAEGFAVHMLLAHWITALAWVFTASSTYAALWFIADYRATVLRPVLLGEDEATFRAGLRWTLSVPRTEIRETGRQKPEWGKECLNLTLLGTPTHWITLREPTLAHGPYGMSRRVRAIGIEADEPEALSRALASWPR